MQMLSLFLFLRSALPFLLAGLLIAVTAAYLGRK